MLYGNIIFIKKTGGDGSKYPVTDKSLKIGRSEDCLIRIYNTQVALEHCELIIGDNGQAILKDLCKQTILNGNLLDQEEVTLCHGDVFKVGERLARWEYLPTSRYCRQLLSPTGRLVAVVMPQQRSLEDESTPGTSASSTSVVKNTPSGGKRRYSERFASENTSELKMRKSCSSDLMRKSKVDLSKFLAGRHSLKTTKLLLPGTKLKDRKSISGVISSRTPKKKSRKSTLPSWKVNVVTPPTKPPVGSETKLQRKSMRSPKNTDKNVLMEDSADLKSEESVVNLRTLRTPQKVLTTSKDIAKSVSKGVPKTPLKTITESPPKGRESVNLRQSFSKSPSSKLTLSTPSPKSVRLVRSESKLRSSLRNSSVIKSKNKRLSVALLREDFTKRNINKKLSDAFSLEGSNNKRENSNVELNLPLENEKIEEVEVKGKRGSLKTLTMKTPRKAPSRSSVAKTDNSPREKSKTPRMSASKKVGESLARGKLKTPREIKKIEETSALESSVNAKKGSPRSKTPASVKRTPLNKSQREVKKSGGRGKPSSSRKVLNKSISSTSSSAASTPRTSSGRSSRKTELSKKKTPSGGVRRKLSPSISSAERAAKKLKISSPKKPDKNKKAALLVLGKASRRHFAPNVKVLLKQKIIKKAIKQSTATNAQQSASVNPVIAVKGRVKKEAVKRTSKSKTQGKKKENSRKEDSSPKSVKSKEEEPLCQEKLEFLAKLQRVFQEKFPFAKFNQLTGQNGGIESGPTTSNLFNEARGKSISNQPSESPQSGASKSASEEKSSPFENVDKNTENFFLSSIRRCSKRLSSKNDTGRPDFVELSPTALGLIPKNLEIFKTPKQNKRRISNLVTPKNDQCVGIIRSATTSKVGNRKSVRFSSKESSINSDLFSPKAMDKTDFDFGDLQTPNVSVDVFVSPLGDKSTSQKGLNDLSRIALPTENNSAFASVYKSNSEPRKCVRKLLQSPQPNKRTSFNQRELPRGRRSTSRSPASAKVQEQSAVPESNLADPEQDLMIFTTPKIQKSSRSSTIEYKQVGASSQSLRDGKGPKNDLSDLEGVKKLLTTPKAQKSPKNDLSDVRGVKKLLATPKVQRSPKNDLTDVRGVKKLLRTPRVQRSPKNDLSDVRGVKKLLRTPQAQKSPKNELTDLRGVKMLLGTPKVQKSPKNDLSDLRGVKKLLRTPKEQKSPKNDLTDVRGVKTLLTTPKVQKSPKNDLSDVRGVKKLLATLKVQKSPKNELTDLRGVKMLLGTPKAQKSPKNDLSDVRGVKRLLRTPRVQRSPKNDLSDLRGVKKLLRTPKEQRSPKNDLSDVTGVEELLGSPKNEVLSSPEGRKMSHSGGAGTERFSELVKENVAERTSPRLLKSPRKGSAETPVTSPKAQQAGTEMNASPESPRVSLHSVGTESKSPGKASAVKADNAKASKEGRGGSKGPKNDLSDVTGVRELFSRHEPRDDADASLTGIAELFDGSEAEVVTSAGARKSYRGAKSGVAALATAEEEEVISKRTTRAGLRKGAAVETTKRAVRGRNVKVPEDNETGSTRGKSLKRKTAEESRVAKSAPAVKRAQRLAKETKKAEEEGEGEETSESGGGRGSRKRKAVEAEVAPSPPKTRRKQAAAVKSNSNAGTGTVRTVRRTAARSKTTPVSTVKTVRSVRTASKNVKAKTTKTSSKVQNKRSQSASKKDPSESQEKSSPMRTRTTRGRAAAAGSSRSEAKKAAVEKKVSKSTSGRAKSSPVVKRSTRRK